jgi:hypothetical protein
LEQKGIFLVVCCGYLARTKKSFSYILLFAVAAFLLLTGLGDALAQERPAWRDDPLGNRFVLGAGLYAPRLDTQVRRDSSSGMLGTLIDFESTLGMDDKDLLPLLFGHYRVAKNHRIIFQYFRLDRSGNSVSGEAIRFGDITFPADLPLSSFFNVDVYSLGYSYSLIHDNKKELAFSVGLQFQAIEMGIAGNLGPGLIRSEADVVAPLPTFGGSFNYAISEKWLFTSLVGIFGIELDLGDDSEFSGEILQINAGIVHKTFKNVGFALHYNYFSVDVDIEDPNWVGLLKYEYRGPVLSVVAYF